MNASPKALAMVFTMRGMRPLPGLYEQALRATTPPGSWIEAYVRAGDDPATIDDQTQYGPFRPSPASLVDPPKGPVPSSDYLKVTVRFVSSDGQSNPTLNDIRVVWFCE